MIFVDSNIIFDIWDRDPVWAPWSENQILNFAQLYDLAINPVVYAELSPRFNSRTRLDEAIKSFPFLVLGIPREAAFRAGLAFLEYRKRGGTRSNVLPDFFIGAHAAVLGVPLLTRDARRYATYFPTLRLITPPPPTQP